MNGSQDTFDKIQHLLHTAKRNAVDRRDAETWDNLDKTYWLLLRLVHELSSEVSNRRPRA